MSYVILALSHLQHKGTCQNGVHWLELSFQHHYTNTLCNWIMDVLTDRSQAVGVYKNRLHSFTLNAGAPQGCVLSHLLFMLLTHDCVAQHQNNHIIKFAGDTTVVGTQNNMTVYRENVIDLKVLMQWHNLLTHNNPSPPTHQWVRLHGQQYSDFNTIKTILWLRIYHVNRDFWLP